MLDIGSLNKKFLSGKHEFEFSLTKAWSFFGFSNIFNFSCCSCNQPLNEKTELIIYGDENSNKESEIKMNGENLKMKMKKN